mgnify:CR=1 FL=1
MKKVLRTFIGVVFYFFSTATAHANYSNKPLHFGFKKSQNHELPYA